MILFVLEMEWVLSTGQDKHFTWHCSESGQRLGGYRTSAGACGLQYPLLSSRCCFCSLALKQPFQFICLAVLQILCPVWIQCFMKETVI